MKSASAALLLVALAVPTQALGHEVLHTTESGKAWSVKAYFADGEVLAYTPYEIYSPADTKIPYQKGRTDRSGYVAFVPDTPGAWRVKIIDESGHGLDTLVEVSQAGAPLASAPASTAGFALRPLVGLVAIAAVFASLMLAYRRRGARP